VRLPPKLPIVGRNKGLHARLNRLLEAVAASQMQIPHNIKRVQTHQGVLLEGGMGGQVAPSNGRAIWL
jgi:hypothetical protein